MVEHRSPKPRVGGSSPSWPATTKNPVWGVFFGLNMSVQEDQQEFRFGALKWLVVFALIAVGVWGNSYFDAQPMIVRALVLVVLGVAAVVVAVQTAQGNAFWRLTKEAQVEVRKVVWPTRQETNQTTLIVVAVVFVMGLILWGLDTFFGWLASLIIG